jgi:predicted metal-binding protein
MRNLIPFKSSKELIPESLLKTLKAKGRDYGLVDVIPIAAEDIQVAQWVTLKCRYGCKRYNSSWCCPPATPGPEEVKEILKEYHSALILVGRHRSPDFYSRGINRRLQQIQCWKGSVSLERCLFLEGYYKAFALVGEVCVLCKECSYPAECKFPQERRPTVESFSIDVIGTLQGLGITTSVARDLNEAFSYFSIILLH